jgi:hypothetical protein
VNVYAVPLVKPEIVNGDADPEIVAPLFAVTVYEVTVDPPLFAGAENEIVASESPTAADTAVGAFGTVDGVAEFDAVDSREVPIPFVATTLNV